ncbi:MAG: hypothetical protein KJS67_01035, partial [Actinomycetales bacterium]|nr:hypothetical protein [Actinomycetales bacterium]
MVSLLRPFRKSLFVRVFTATSIFSAALIYLLGSNLESRIENGIIEEKISSSISEANSVIQFATYKLTIGALTVPKDLPALAEEIVNSTEVGAQESGREIVLVNFYGQIVEGIPATSSTKYFSSNSLSADLRNKVRTSSMSQWEIARLKYVDGTSS